MVDTNLLTIHKQIYELRVVKAINIKNILIANTLQFKNKYKKNLLLANIKKYYESAVKNFQQNYISGVNNEYLRSPYITNYQNIDSSSKKALLIGCNYINTDNELYGCINDVIFIKSKLEEHNFTENDITIMTDESLDKLYPNKTNILNSFINFLSASKSGDTLFFSFSGHGSRITDISGDEKSGLDNVIVPLDLDVITDDELKICIQLHLNKDATLFLLFDACFSETMLDLKYQYLDTINNNENTINANDITFGNVIMISGCQDTQTSADAYIEYTSRGALNWALLEALKDSNTTTWLQLLTNIRTSLNNSNYTQIPQISSGKPLDLNSKIFFL